MPYNPAAGGENVILGWSSASADFAFPQMGAVTNDGVGHQYAPLFVTSAVATGVPSQPIANVDTGAMITAVAATTSQTGADQINNSGKGLVVFVNITNIGTGSITLNIQGKDPTSGLYYTILSSAALIANAFTQYRVYVGLTAAANLVASDILPRTWRVTTTANNANAASYTVSASVIE